MRNAAAILSALCLSLVAGAAHATCSDAVYSAADEAQVGAGLASTTVRSLRETCGDVGPAKVVDELVNRGACDEAAQLGRTLSGYAGMDRAVSRADECLAEQLRWSLDELEVAAADPAPPASAPRAQDSERYDYDASDLAFEPDEPMGDYYDESGNVGVVGGLGTRGSGYGGGGTEGLLADSTSSGDGYGRGGESRSSRESSLEAAGPVSKQRKYKGNTGASTGMGRYVQSPTDDRVAAASIATGAEVVWSQLSFRVWFDYDSASLRPEALSTLATLAEHVGTLQDGTVLEIVGHTDSTGSWWYNDDLSVRRARSVEQALRIAGIPESKLAVRGLGESQPAHSNYSDYGRARNRRVEFRFYKPVASRQITR